MCGEISHGLRLVLADPLQKLGRQRHDAIDVNSMYLIGHSTK